MFGPPFGPVDPQLLPAILRRQILAPNQVPGPVPAIELKPGYRPPSGGLSAMPAPPPVPGFNIRSGLEVLNQGLAGWRPPAPRPADATRPGVPTRQGDPTGGAGPAYLGGTTPLGSPTGLQQLTNVLDFLTGGWNPKGGFSA